MARVVDRNRRDRAKQARLCEVGEVGEVEETMIEGELALGHKVVGLAVDPVVEEKNRGSAGVDEGTLNPLDVGGRGVLDLVVVALQQLSSGIGVEGVVIDDHAELGWQGKEGKDVADLMLLKPS